MSLSHQVDGAHTRLRSRLFIVVCLVVLTLALGGCGKSTTTTNNGSSGVATDTWTPPDVSTPTMGQTLPNGETPVSPSPDGLNPDAPGNPGGRATPIDTQGASAQEVASRFLTAWAAEDTATAAGLSTDPTSAKAAFDSTLSSLKATVDVIPGVLQANDTTATQTYTTVMHLAGLGDWSYTATTALAHTAQGWKVKWAPSIIHPQLSASTMLTRAAGPAGSTQIFDRNGKPLTEPVAVVEVGIQPNKLTNPTLAYNVLGRMGVDVAAAQAQVQASPAEVLLPQITLRKVLFDSYAAEAAAAGLVTTPSTRMLTPGINVARGVLASVLGSSHVTQASAGTAVVLASKGANDVGQVLHNFPASGTSSITTTLDSTMQIRAEEALNNTVNKKAAALVVMNNKTGEILAVANRDNTGNSTAFNRAFVGQYPPGSTFKVISSSAFLQAGLKITDPVACPGTITIAGHLFRNYESFALGTVPFRDDFAYSCNTAMIGQSDKLLNYSSLNQEAQNFGLGLSTWGMGVSAFTGSVPVSTGPVEKAAMSFGQGPTLVSPLALTNVAATVASGSWHAPRLITAVTQGGSTKAITNPTPARPLATAGTLQQLMYASATYGTGKNTIGTLVGSRAAGQIGSKTGTAEFSSDPENTHAWIIGFIDDLAFGVIVESGGVGGSVAGPVAKTFLRSIGY